MTLLFATNNQNKFKEAGRILPSNISLLSLKDIDCADELPETGSTILANARQKARYVSEKFGVDCFSDDTGLEVTALQGRPGVHSARYAGNHADPAENNAKLLNEMKGVADRSAAFRTAIVLYIGKDEFFFEGIIKGTIAEMPSGTNGFGYDPVFIPEGHTKTFSEMDEAEKNSMSHRAIAIGKLAVFLAERF